MSKILKHAFRRENRLPLGFILFSLLIMLLSCDDGTDSSSDKGTDNTNSKMKIKNIHLIIDYSYSMRGFASGGTDEGSGSIYNILSKLRDLAKDQGAKITLYRTGSIPNKTEPHFELLEEYIADEIVNSKSHLSVKNFAFAGNVYRQVFQEVGNILKKDENSICILLTDGIFSPVDLSLGMEKEEESDIRYFLKSLINNKTSAAIHHFRLPYRGNYPYPPNCTGANCRFIKVNESRNLFMFSFGKSQSLHSYHHFLNSSHDASERPQAFQFFNDSPVHLKPFGSPEPIDNTIKVKVIDPLKVFDVKQIKESNTMKLLEDGKEVDLRPIINYLPNYAPDTVINFFFKDKNLKKDKEYTIIFKNKINNKIGNLCYKDDQSAESAPDKINHNKTYKLEVLLNAYIDAFEPMGYASYKFSY